MLKIQKRLPSGRAADELGLSKSTLRRYCDSGILAEGTHFRRGVTDKSPWRWDVVAISRTLERLASRPPRLAAAATLEGGQADG